MHICMWNYNCLQMRIPMCLYNYIHMYIGMYILLCLVSSYALRINDNVKLLCKCAC